MFTGSTLKRKRFAIFPKENNFSLMYEVGENISQVYPGEVHVRECYSNTLSVHVRKGYIAIIVSNSVA